MRAEAYPLERYDVVARRLLGEKKDWRGYMWSRPHVKGHFAALLRVTGSATKVLTRGPNRGNLKHTSLRRATIEVTDAAARKVRLKPWDPATAEKE